MSSRKRFGKGCIGALFAAGMLGASACSLPAAGKRHRVESTMSINLPPVSETTLENGLRLLAIEYHELPLVTFTALIPAGSSLDPRGKEGVAHLTAGLLTRGTATRDAMEVAEEIEFLGGSLSAEAGRDFAVVTGEFLVKDIDAGLELFREVLLAPAFIEREVQMLKREVKSGILALREDPSSIADRCLSLLLFGEHPYGHPATGTEESIDAIERGDVLSFYRKYYRPEGSVVAIAGDLSAADLLARLMVALREWPKRGTAPARLPQPRPVLGRQILVVDKPDATQTQIRIGNLGIARTDPAYVGAKVMSTILGGGFSSRLVDELRIKRSLTYGAWSYFQPQLLPGEFTVGTFSKTATAAEAVRVAFDVMREYATEGPTPQEMERVKSYLVGQYPLQLETPNLLIGKLAAIEAYGLPRSELVTYPDKVAAVERFEIMAAAARYLPVDSAAVVIVGPADALAESLSPFGPVKVVQPKDCDRPEAIVSGASARWVSGGRGAF